MIVDCVCLPLCVFSTKNKYVEFNTQHTSLTSLSSSVCFVLLSVVVFCLYFLLFILVHLPLVKLRTRCYGVSMVERVAALLRF